MRAKAAHQAGKLIEAEQLYQAALSGDGGNLEALFRLSVLYAQLARHEQALLLVEQALARSPASAQLHFHRAEVLAAMGHLPASVAALRNVLILDPNHVDALANLADSLIATGNATEALVPLERALALQPGHVPSINNLANALQALGRHEEALRGFERALAVEPANPHILANRAATLLALDRHADAEAACRAALARDPRHAVARLNLARSQARRLQHAAALATLDELLGLYPGDARAWCERGSVLAGTGRQDDAWASLDKALKLDPNLADAWQASAILYRSVAKYDSALKCFSRVLDLEPANAVAWRGMGETLRLQGRDDEALQAFSKALNADGNLPFVHGQIAWQRLRCCDWQHSAGEIQDLIAGVRAGKPVAMPLDFIAMTDSAEDQLRCARTHAALRCRAPGASPVWRGERYRNARIRVAYVSADFRDHPVAYLIAGLLERHDRSRFEVFGYSLAGKSTTPYGLRAERAFEHFTSVKEMSDLDVARSLRGREIDIVVDLMGPTWDARPGIFALRPSPVQVNYLGFPGTMGAEFMDYILADAYVIPPETERHYLEKVVRLPDTFQCNDSKRGAAAAAPSRAEAGLPPEGVIYCCFNNSAKFSPVTFDLWMRVLREVPSSVLWLPAAHPIVQGNLGREAQARGIEAQRLVFAPRVKDYDEHLARLSLADAFLDTLPYNAHTTASDALWAGVPVVTRPGEALAARVAGSLLHAIGMPELITSTPAEYAALAVRLGKEPEFLAATKAKLAGHRSTAPLFDTDRFRRHIEAAYLAMWERVQRGETPDRITVAPIG